MAKHTIIYCLPIKLYIIKKLLTVKDVSLNSSQRNTKYNITNNKKIIISTRMIIQI